MPLSTRELLSRALRQQLLTTRLNRVTVSSLSAQAGINRQTFYYHFADVYDLAVWVFEQEIANHVLDHASYGEWAEGYRTLLQYMQAHREQTQAVLNSISHQRRDEFFLGQFRSMMEAIVAELQGDIVLADVDRQFVIDHYASSIHGHFLRWLARDAQDDPDVLVANIQKILKGSVRESLERFAQPIASTGREV